MAKHRYRDLEKEEDENLNQVFVCDSCLFLFEGDRDMDRCPDCGSRNIRRADREEQDEYWRLRMEFGYVKAAS